MQSVGSTFDQNKLKTAIIIEHFRIVTENLEPSRSLGSVSCLSCAIHALRMVVVFAFNRTAQEKKQISRLQ